MDRETLVYGTALIVAPIIAYYLAVLDAWLLAGAAPLALRKRLVIAARWGVIVAIVAFAAVIDCTGTPYRGQWLAVILVNSPVWPVLAVVVREYGWELRLWRDE